ncbi:MAG: hypothetical protein ACOCYZ_04090 [Halococcoides sp.]
MSFYRFKDLKSEFQDLTAEKQERLFALSSFQSDHIEAGFPARISDIEREQKEALEELYGHNKWQNINRKGDVEAVLSNFEQGDALNFILSWFLEDKYPRYATKPEGGNSESEFDVTLLDQEIHLCGIELKRAGSSNRITHYLKEHRQKCEGPREARKFILVNIFPISEKMDSVRATDLVIGYGPLSAETHSFYQQENSHVANIPAPLYREESDITPLREIYRILREELNIT